MYKLSGLAVPGPVSSGETPAPGGTPPRSGISRLAGELEHAPPWTGVVIVLGVIVLALAFSEPLFLTRLNIENLFATMSVPLLLAAGTTVVVITGVIDLSLVGILAVSSMVLVGLMNLNLPGPVSVLGTIAFAAVVAGGVNGVLVAKAKLSFFIVTLGSLTAFSAIAQLPTQGQDIALTGKHGSGFVLWFGNANLGPVPAPILIAAAITLLVGWGMRGSTYGRALFATGGNDAAARLGGIRVDRVRIAAFALNGLLIGAAAVVLTARAHTATPVPDDTLEFQIIASVLLGGSSLLGGSATMVGTFFGVLFVAVLQNGLNLIGVSIYWQGIVTGGVLILAVWVDRLRAVQTS